MSETQKAQTAKPGGDTIFGKIIRGEIPTDFVHKDDLCVAFNDISPQAPVHVLVVPVKPIERMATAEDSDKELLGHLLLVCRKIAKDLALDDGYRLIINDGQQGGQSVYHLHIHIMGRRQLEWPPG